MPDISDVGREYPKLTKKFIESLFKINPKISNYEEFKETGKKFSKTKKGKIILLEIELRKIEIGMRSMFGNKFDATFEEIYKNTNKEDKEELLKCKTQKDLINFTQKIAKRILPP